MLNSIQSNNARPAFGCTCPYGRQLAGDLVRKGADAGEAMGFVLKHAPADGLTFRDAMGNEGFVHHDTLITDLAIKVGDFFQMFRK